MSKGDWTRNDDGYSNSSAEYKFLVAVVNDLIRGDAHEMTKEQQDE